MSAPLTRPQESIERDQSVPYPEEGHAWIQWKGTNVCMDVHCRCGEMGHVDAEFAYFYRCKACGTAFAVGQTVRLYAIDPAHEGDVMTIEPISDEENAR